MAISEIISYILLSLGCFFIFTSVIGALRMPDFYTRIHALGVGDICGVPLFLLGLIFKIGLNYHSGKILILMAFLLITSPTATHIISRLAYKNGLKPLGDIEDDRKSDDEGKDAD